MESVLFATMVTMGLIAGVVFGLYLLARLL